MQLVHVSRWNQSHVSVRVRSVRAASSHDATDQDKTSSGKKVDKIYAHNKIVFYSCNRELRIDLAHDATVGERCRKLKFFLRFHQDPSMSSSKQRVKGVSLHLHTTCRSRAEAFKGMVMMESYSP